MLEGDKYTSILPSDYISYLRHPETNDNVNIAYKTNHQIANWVKHSILRTDDRKMRRGRLEFFVRTAEVMIMYW